MIQGREDKGARHQSGHERVHDDLNTPINVLVGIREKFLYRPEFFQDHPLPHFLAEPDKIYLGIGSIFRFVDRYPLGHNDVRCRVLRVFDIADFPCACRTGLYAGGLHSFRDPVVAEIALFSHLIYGVEKSHSVGAGHDAIAASNTPLPVNEDNSVCRLIGGTYRADLHTGRFIALVAEFRHKKGFIDMIPFDILITTHSQVHAVRREPISRFLRGIGEDPAIFGDDIPLHPGPGDIGFVRDFIFELAGPDTEPAANALVCIHEKYPADRLYGGQAFPGSENFIQAFGAGDAGNPLYG
jgi:hypothetical protein